MMAVDKKAFIATIAISIAFFSLFGVQITNVAKANPSWGTPATPIPPITDPPEIIITSPSSEEYSNPVPLNITIIQPDSWVSIHNMTLPKPWVDNSDNVVAGQNTLRSITCIIDGQSFTLWNGTYFDFAVTYYLPRVTQFSALMSVSKGQHNLQVNVFAISEYVVEGIIPFASRTYNISASQTTKFNVDNGSNSISPKLYSIKSSYEIGQSASDLTPSPTPISTPIVAPAVSILTPQNDSFFNVSLGGVSYQLIYETSSSLSWVGYSLDGVKNVTVTGNGTSVHEFVSSSEYHTLTVYANDTLGNWAVPQTVTYLVNFYPDYTPAPSQSPTQQLTTEHSPSPSIPEFPSCILLPSILVVTVVTSLVVKRKKLQES